MSHCYRVTVQEHLKQETFSATMRSFVSTVRSVTLHALDRACSVTLQARKRLAFYTALQRAGTCNCRLIYDERTAMAQKKSANKNPKAFSHPDYDAAVLDCFLEKQLQLFPEEVASTPEEAADFLEMCFAVVAKSKREVRQYFEEVGTDVEGEDIFSAAEVFPVGDGRYLIVEG